MAKPKTYKRLSENCRTREEVAEALRDGYVVRLGRLAAEACVGKTWAINFWCACGSCRTASAETFVQSAELLVTTGAPYGVEHSTEKQAQVWELVSRVLWAARSADSSSNPPDILEVAQLLKDGDDPRRAAKVKPDPDVMRDRLVKSIGRWPERVRELAKCSTSDAGAKALAASARLDTAWPGERVVLDVDTLFGACLDGGHKRIGWPESGERFGVPVATLRAARFLVKTHQDLVAYVTREGLHLRWRAGRGGARLLVGPIGGQRNHARGRSARAFAAVVSRCGSVVQPGRRERASNINGNVAP